MSYEFCNLPGMEERNFTDLKEELERRGVKLVAVSKTKTVDNIFEIYWQGQRAFGENRAQELADKQPHLPADINWHMIGHLQTNKVKYIAPFVAMIESVDSEKLLRTISKEAVKNNRIIDILLQFKIAEEETKFGLDFQEAEEMLDNDEIVHLPGIRFRGVMGMASFVDDQDQVRREFRQLKSIFDRLKEQYFRGTSTFDIVSMGMSGDYEVALEEGSTMVRLGSIIFGARN